jgi:cell fate (sporulation/competence/biofilm development) regulator YmcA (YheA/YmcA/DUF963 family)
MKSSEIRIARSIFAPWLEKQHDMIAYEMVDSKIEASLSIIKDFKCDRILQHIALAFQQWKKINESMQSQNKIQRESLTLVGVSHLFPIIEDYTYSYAVSRNDLSEIWLITECNTLRVIARHTSRHAMLREIITFLANLEWLIEPDTNFRVECGIL